MSVVWEYHDGENVDVGPPELYIDGVNVGFLNGDCTLSYTTETLQLKYGVPLTTRVSVITERTAVLSCEMLELTPNNYNLVAGDADLTSGSTETVHVTDEAATFASMGGDDQQINLAHTRNVSNVSVTSSDGQTTYTINEDFRVDYGAALIFRVSSGSIPESGQVKVSYDYEQETEGGSIRLKVGADNALKTIRNIVIHKYNPRRSGKQHQIVHIWAMQSRGAIELTYSADVGSWMTLPAEFEVVADFENHPDAPLFEIEWSDNFEPPAPPNPNPGPPQNSEP